MAHDPAFVWFGVFLGPTDAKSGEFYKLRVKDLSPTQFAVGKAEVDVCAGCIGAKWQES